MNKPESKNMVFVVVFSGFCDVSFNSWRNGIWNGLIPLGKTK